MSYKSKNIILVFFILVLFGIIYSRAISKTIELRKSYYNLSLEKLELENSNSNLLSLKNRLTNLDVILKEGNISLNNSFQQIILKKINQFKKNNQLELVEFNNSIEVKVDQNSVNLYPILVQGDFNILNTFLNYIEKQGLGEIMNFKFQKKINYRTKKEFLQLKLIIKRVELKT